MNATDQTITNDDSAGRLERLEIEITPTDPPPCPEWCTLPAGHEYDASEYDAERFDSLDESAAAGELIVCRYHRRVLRDVERETVDVSQLERASVRRGGAEPVVAFDEPEITTVFAFDDLLTPADARELAGVLIDAAELVERIAG